MLEESLVVSVQFHQLSAKSQGSFARIPLKSGLRRLSLATWAISSQALLFAHTLNVGLTGSRIIGLRNKWKQLFLQTSTVNNEIHNMDLSNAAICSLGEGEAGKGTTASHCHGVWKGQELLQGQPGLASGAEWNNPPQLFNPLLWLDHASSSALVLLTPLSSRSWKNHVHAN